MAHVVERWDPHSILRKDTVVCHDQEDVERLESKRDSEDESEAMVFVVAGGADARVHQKVEEKDGEIDAGEYDVRNHHSNQVVGKLVNEGVGVHFGGLVHNVDVDVDIDGSTAEPVTGVTAVDALSTAHQEDIVELGGGRGDSEGEVTAVDEGNVVLVQALVMVVARHHAIQVRRIVLLTVAAIVGRNAAVERSRHEALAVATLVLLQMVELLPRGGRDERKHHRLVVTVMAAAGVTQRRTERKDLVVFLHTKLGQKLKSGLLLVVPASTYPGELDRRRENQHNQHDSEDQVMCFHLLSLWRCALDGVRKHRGHVLFCPVWNRVISQRTSPTHLNAGHFPLQSKLHHLQCVKFRLEMDSCNISCQPPGRDVPNGFRHQNCSFCDDFENVQYVYLAFSLLSGLSCLLVFLTYLVLPRLRHGGHSSIVFIYR